MTATEIIKLAVFEGKQIRKTIHEEEWWFSVADVVEALTDSIDVRQYIKRMRRRDPELDSYWGTICTPLELLAPDGKRRKTNCSNTEGLFRIIQSIPSPKAEPFKRWLAKVGHERIQSRRTKKWPSGAAASPARPAGKPRRSWDEARSAKKTFYPGN